MCIISNLNFPWNHGNAIILKIKTMSVNKLPVPLCKSTEPPFKRHFLIYLAEPAILHFSHAAGGWVEKFQGKKHEIGYKFQFPSASHQPFLYIHPSFFLYLSKMRLESPNKIVKMKVEIMNLLKSNWVMLELDCSKMHSDFSHKRC